MDEPFSALDVQTRTLMENELLDLWGSTERVRRLRHPRPGGGDRPGRPRRRHHRRPRHGQGKLTRSTCPRPRERAEIRFEPRFVRALRGDLGRPAGEVGGCSRSYERGKAWRHDRHAHPAPDRTVPPTGRRRRDGRERASVAACSSRALRAALAGCIAGAGLAIVVVRLSRGRPAVNARGRRSHSSGGSPSGDLGRAARLVHRTARAQGSLWRPDRSSRWRRRCSASSSALILGIVFGVALGRHPTPFGRARPVHQGGERDPPRGPRLASSPSRFGLGDPVEGRPSRSCSSSSCVFFNAFQGVREVDRNLHRQRPHARRQRGGQVTNGRRRCRRRFRGSSRACTRASAFALVGAMVGESSARTRASAC